MQVHRPGNPGDIGFWRCLCGIAAALVATTCSIDARAAEGTWVDLNPEAPTRVTDANLTDVDFVTASTGIVVGTNGTILRTDDSGAGWTDVGPGTNASLQGIAFVDGVHAVAVGTAGTILRSDDGGLTWAPQVSGTQEHLYGVDFSDAQTGTAVGAAGTILRTTDGIVWTPQSSGNNVDFRAVSFVDAQNGFVAGSEGVLLETNDGGASWRVYTGVVRCRDHHGVRLCNSFVDVCFANGSKGFVAGSPADPPYLAGGSFFKTESSGATWFTQAPPPSDLDVFVAVSFGSDSDGLLFGSGRQPVVYYTGDGGATWDAMQTPLLPGTLNAASHGGANTAYAVGSNGTIVRWNGDTPTPAKQKTWGALKSRYKR